MNYSVSVNKKNRPKSFTEISLLIRKTLLILISMLIDLLLDVLMTISEEGKTNKNINWSITLFPWSYSKDSTITCLLVSPRLPTAMQHVQEIEHDPSRPKKVPSPNFNPFTFIY